MKNWFRRKRIDGANTTLAEHDQAASVAIKERMGWATEEELESLAEAFPLEWDEWISTHHEGEWEFVDE